MDYRTKNNYSEIEKAIHIMVTTKLRVVGYKSIKWMMRHLPTKLDLISLELVLSNVYEMKNSRVKASINQLYKRRKG